MLRTGDILFDEFRIDGQIENGKSGATYRAFDLKHRRKVSITTLNIQKYRQDIDAARALQDQLLREINLSARFYSPYILQVYRSILSADNLYIFTEYIPGFCLVDQIAAHKENGRLMSFEEVRRIGQQIAAGLNVFHGNGILHLNLYPNNLFITVKGDIKIGGIGTALTPEDRVKKILKDSGFETNPAAIDYKAPEIVNGGFPYPRPNLDIYAVGSVLFELMTGVKYSQQPPGTHAASLRERIPQWFDELLSESLSVDPSVRPWDAFELYERLDKSSSNPTGILNNHIDWLVGEANILASDHRWEDIQGILNELNALGYEGQSAARGVRLEFNLPDDQGIATENNGTKSADISSPTGEQETAFQEELEAINAGALNKTRPKLLFLGFGVMTLCLFSMAFLFLINQGVNYLFVTTALASVEKVEIEAPPPVDDGEPSLKFIVEENPVSSLIIGRDSDSVSLDPAVASDVESLRVSALCLEGLYTRHPADNAPQPALAAGCSPNEEQTEWTCSLLENLRFHDGTPFNADAVIFNFQRWRLLDHPQHFESTPFENYASTFGGFDDESLIRAEEKINEYTIKFTLARPAPDFPEQLAGEAFSISSPNALESLGEDYGSAGSGCVGTGPFVFDEWVEDDHITLAANASYWYGPPQTDQIVWKVLPDNAARFQALQDGSIHASLESDSGILSAAEDHPDLQVILANYPPAVVVTNAALGALSRVKGFDIYSGTELLEE